MARKYSERISDMDDEAREELDAAIRKYHENNNWQATLAKYKPSPIQLRAILAGKDASKAKPKKKPAAAAAKPAAKKKAKKAAKKKPAAKKKAKKAAKKAAPKTAKKKKVGRPKGSGKKKAAKKNGVTKANVDGTLIIEGRIDAGEFVGLILAHSERVMQLALSA